MRVYYGLTIIALLGFKLHNCGYDTVRPKHLADSYDHVILHGWLGENGDVQVVVACLVWEK